MLGRHGLGVIPIASSAKAIGPVTIKSDKVAITTIKVDGPWEYKMEIHYQGTPDEVRVGKLYYLGEDQSLTPMFRKFMDAGAAYHSDIGDFKGIKTPYGIGVVPSYPGAREAIIGVATPGSAVDPYYSEAAGGYIASTEAPDHYEAGTPGQITTREETNPGTLGPEGGEIIDMPDTLDRMAATQWFEAYIKTLPSGHRRKVVAFAAAHSEEIMGELMAGHEPSAVIMDLMEVQAAVYAPEAINEVVFVKLPMSTKKKAAIGGGIAAAALVAFNMMN